MYLLNSLKMYIKYYIIVISLSYTILKNIYLKN